MKYLILSIIVFSVTAHAENWLNHSKIVAGSVEAHSLKQDCENRSGEICYDLQYPSSTYSEVDKEIDDESRPMYSKNNIESCENESSCDLIHESKDCFNGEYSIKNYDLLEVYCSKQIGFYKKIIKAIELDQAKLLIYQSGEVAKAQLAAYQAAKNKVKAHRECLTGVIDLLVMRNASKNLSTLQVEQMVSTYQPIMSVLQAVSGVTAKEKILAVSADGVLVAEADKVALVGEIDKCLLLAQ